MPALLPQLDPSGSMGTNSGPSCVHGTDPATAPDSRFENATVFVGYFDQTDIFFKMSKVLGSNMRSLDEALEEKDEFPIIDQNY